MESNWRNIQYRFFKDNFTVTDTKTHIWIAVIPMNLSDVQKVKNKLTTFKDQRSRPGNIPEVREMLSRIGIKYGFTGGAVPGYEGEFIDDTEDTEEEDN